MTLDEAKALLSDMRCNWPLSADHFYVTVGVAIARVHGSAERFRDVPEDRVAEVVDYCEFSRDVAIANKRSKIIGPRTAVRTIAERNQLTDDLLVDGPRFYHPTRHACP